MVPGENRGEGDNHVFRKSRLADSYVLTKAKIRRCPEAFGVPPALVSQISPRADSSAESVRRTPKVASSHSLFPVNSEPGGIALAPEPITDTNY